MRLMIEVSWKHFDRHERRYTANAEAGFLLQFAVRGFLDALTGFYRAGRKSDFVRMRAWAIFADEQYRPGIEHRNNQHRRSASRMDAFEPAFGAIGKPHEGVLDREAVRLGDLVLCDYEW